jgi:hypothetical protein
LIPDPCANSEITLNPGPGSQKERKIISVHTVPLFCDFRVVIPDLGANSEITSPGPGSQKVRKNNFGPYLSAWILFSPISLRELKMLKKWAA